MVFDHFVVAVYGRVARGSRDGSLLKCDLNGSYNRGIRHVIVDRDI